MIFIVFLVNTFDVLVNSRFLTTLYFALGFIYDFRKSYDDVFWVVGGVYVIDVVLFASIPWIKWRRERNEASKLDYNEIAGVVGQHRQTFKIGKSHSKSSLKDEEIAGYQQQQPQQQPQPTYQSYSDGVRGQGSGAPDTAYQSDPLNNANQQDDMDYFARQRNAAGVNTKQINYVEGYTAH